MKGEGSLPFPRVYGGKGDGHRRTRRLRNGPIFFLFLNTDFVRGREIGGRRGLGMQGGHILHMRIKG